MHRLSRSHWLTPRGAAVPLTPAHYLSMNASMTLALNITPDGSLLLTNAPSDDAISSAPAVNDRITKAFAEGQAAGLLHLAAGELQTPLPPSLEYFRALTKDYLTRLCHRPDEAASQGHDPVEPPSHEELAFRCMQAPPMQGLEYLNADVLERCWRQLDAFVRAQIGSCPGGVTAYLKNLGPLWRLVGRVTFHLAENKRDTQNPFAFLATYITHVTDRATLRHLPLSEALKQYADARQKQQLLALLTPIEQAAQRSSLVRELVQSGDIYHPVAWQPDKAYRFLKDIPIFEDSGLVVRVPNWWRTSKPPRPVVNVRIGSNFQTQITSDALLDFSVNVTIDGQTITEEEIRAILAASNGLTLLRGKWVEIDRDKLAQTLALWKNVEHTHGQEGLSFSEAMRLLAGAGIQGVSAAAAAEAALDWSEVTAGEALATRLAALRQSQAELDLKAPAGLNATLRPYQKIGVHWLTFMAQLGLGACLADDMGLGKTIQVLGLLLNLKGHTASAPTARPSLLVLPASLIGNWKEELAQFAPSLRAFIAHPSEPRFAADSESAPADIQDADIVITTYGMAARLTWIAAQHWNLVILDEAQAIKNAGSKQSKSVKQLKAAARVALTGTPVENRLSDLWSIFDFINPGLLGNAKEFATYAKRLSESNSGYAPLRSLVQPYILRRLKTDKSIIADLPEKTEVVAFCNLSKQQIVLYQQAVHELSQQLQTLAGIQRRGVVLAYLMRFKQICNHPAHLLGNGDYHPHESGKFERLRELCEEIAARQEKLLVFSQFRELTAPLAMFLQTIFKREGLVLHGSTAVAERKSLVQQFQAPGGPPFFVLSLKAGGVGLNLTAASHVIHFDRWWNPAVENQATDRAFRIGQKKNVLVHKFVCRGTLEEKIDALIAEKSQLSHQLLQGGAEPILTEMDNQSLLQLVSLDIHRAGEQ